MKQFKQLYRSAALIVMNTFIIFIALNGLLAAFYTTRSVITSALEKSSTVDRSQRERIRMAQPDMSEADIEQMFREHEMIRQTYSAFAQFKEAPLKGRFVNVSDQGYRIIPGQGPWPPLKTYYNIFMFGGSTSFGYGVRDQDTIAYFLQQEMNAVPVDRPVRVYNFGRGGFYSSQERALFTRLSADGFRPDLVIFIDGFNDVATPTTDSESPTYTQVLRRFFNRDFERPAFLIHQLIRVMPVGQFIADIKALRHRPAPAEPSAADNGMDDETVRRMTERYALNMAVAGFIAERIGARALFIWQPVPEFRYDLRYHLFADELGEKSSTAADYKRVYEELERRFSALGLGDDFYWLADMQKDEKRNLYCDSIHYNAVMNRMVAHKILERLHA